MSALRNIWLVAMREITVRARGRGYRLSTLFILVVIVVGGLSLPRLDDVFGTDDAHRIGTVGPQADELAEMLEAAGERFAIEVEGFTFESRETAEAELADDEVDAVLVGTEQLLFADSVDDEVVVVANQAVQQLLLPDQLDAIGVSFEELRPILEPAPLGVSLTEDDSGDEAAGYAVGGISSILLFLAIMTYGQWVLNGVVEEKSSRIIEVLLSTLRPYQLLAGKVGGILLLGMGQLAVLLLAGAFVVATVSDVDIPNVAVSGVLAAAVCFVLGLTLYGALFGAAGALVSRQEEAGNVTMPITSVLTIGYIASITLVQVDPGGAPAKVLALFPLTSPVALPSVVALGEAGPGLFLLGVALLIAAIVAAIVIGARIYSGAVLRIGPRVALREAWRLRG